MEEVESVARNRPHRGRLAKQVVSELLDTPLSRKDSVDIVQAMDDRMLAKKQPRYKNPGTDRTRYKAQQRAEAKRRKAKMKAANRTSLEEQFAELMKKVYAGNPDHPDYEQRKRAAKKQFGRRQALPHVARNKWAQREFRESLMKRGFVYDTALYKGWLPYESAKQMQRMWIGARSRGEYEVLVKLFGITFLPARPDNVYREDWKGWSEFLDVPNIFGFANRKHFDKSKYLPFHEALSIARAARCKNVQEWRVACREGRIPMNVPIDPHAVYPDQYIGINHWLGNDSAMDVIQGKAAVEEFWVLYADGRDNVVWWAKLKRDAYEKLKLIPDVQIHRVYAFEGNLGNDVWGILDSYTEKYEDDIRERWFDDVQAFLTMVQDFDSILLWIKD